MLDLESVLFDEKSSYWTDIASENLVFLKKSEDEVTGLLQIQGYLSLCDLYDVLGLDRYVIDTRGGEPGWVRGIGFVDDIYEFILDDEKMSLCCSSPFCCGL